MKSLLYFLQLIRYQNLIIIILTVFFTNYFLINQSVNFSTVLLLSISTALIAASGYIINDYFDTAIDAVNKPERILVGKFFREKDILFIYLIINILGFYLSSFISISICLIQVFCSLSLYLYARYLKKIALAGNILVATLSAFVVLIINILYQQYQPLIYLFSVFAFFISLIRELIKDIEDIEGDSIGKCKTFPILFGVFYTKWLIICIIFIFIILLFFLPYFLCLQIKHYIFYLVFISIFLSFLAFKVHRSNYKKDFHSASSFCKLIMLLGMIGMIILRL